MNPLDVQTRPVFGLRRPGRVYVERPGAYALIADEHGRLAVVRTMKGRCYLPGGGIDAGESAEQALRREVWEECGRQVDELVWLCAADEYVEAPDEGRSYLKRGAFYLATLHTAPIALPEAGTELLWLRAAEATRRLVHPSQRWVVCQYAQQTSG